MLDQQAMAKAMLSTPQGGKIIKALNRFNEICRTPGGRDLLGMLSGPGAEALSTAAKAALADTNEPGRAMMSSLLSTKDGTALLAKLIEAVGI